MPLYPQVLDIVACPHCKQALHYPHQKPERLVCSSCAIYYDIEEGIPILLPGSAKPLASRDAEEKDSW